MILSPPIEWGHHAMVTPSPLKVKEVEVGGTRYIVYKNERQRKSREILAILFMASPLRDR